MLSYVWELPFMKSNRWIGGWQLSGSSTMNTGAPLAVRGAQNFAADRPNSTGTSAKLTSDQRSADRWFDTSAFTLPALYTFGNVGRVLPDVRGPGVFQLDAGLHKFFPIHERMRLQLRGELFNPTNNVNLGMPNVGILTTQFGRINGTQTPARIIQVGAKLVF